MSSTNVRTCLRRVCDENEVRESDDVPERAASRLDGVSRQLRYYVDGHDTDPEPTARPDPGALVSIRERLLETAAEAGSESSDRLAAACDELERAIETLAERRRRQVDIA